MTPKKEKCFFFSTIAIVILLIILAFFTSNCTRRVYVPVEKTITETQVLRDTVIKLKLDVLHDTITTKDTISYLRNKYATSWAKWSSGKLSHSLATNTESEPETTVKYIDRIRTIEIPKPYEVLRTDTIYKNKPMGWFKTTRMHIGDTASILGITALIIWLIKKRLG